MVCWACLLGSTAAIAAADVERAREGYSDAVEALRRGQQKTFSRLRDDLDDYPLALYLDYYDLSRRPASVRPADANLFVADSSNSPLRNRFLAVYLDRAGRDRRWQDFLAVMPEEPNSVELKCYYFRARLATGDPLAAWEGAERLWVHGRSQPKACDPLFKAWMEADQLDDATVWARMLKAFDARQRSLMAYVARQGSGALEPWADRLQQAYRDPDRIARLDLPAGEPRARDIASHGLALLARYNPERALQEWRNFQARMVFTPAQVAQVETAIVRHSLFAESRTNQPWVDAALARLGDDTLTQIRLRWALGEQDWVAMEALLPLLSEEARRQSVWRYWQASIWADHGDAARAQEALRSLASERDYYGFLAADRLGVEYSFNDRPLVLAPESREGLLQLPAVRRVGELQHHRALNDAHAEWYQLMSDAENTTLQQLAALATGEGWHRMAIDAANRASAWDALDQRFPMPYADTFDRYAALRQVPGTELMAIARRESAFFPGARSPVGARGLMQIMPATGREVARSLGQTHSTSALYDVEHNVLLGSAYYRQLLDRFNGNRVFALTAYNAGPHRVDRWRHPPDESVPAEVWIETIPYRETRNYVQAVLAYNVVFSHRRGEAQAPLLTATERQARY